MVEEKKIAIEIAASYATLNSLTHQTKRVWIVFHGYGQLSRFFVRKFKGLDPETNYIIAPQGLSKFYLEGFSGRVGASWMTKEDRLSEIDHQMQYVDRILATENLPLDHIEVNYLGFSQGVATMCRYVAHARLPFGEMILWAGSVPPELVNKDFDFLLGNESIQYYSGTKDPFYKEGMDQEQKDRIIELTGITPQVNWFEGVHEVKSEIIKNL